MTTTLTTAATATATTTTTAIVKNVPYLFQRLPLSVALQRGNAVYFYNTFTTE